MRSMTYQVRASRVGESGVLNVKTVHDESLTFFRPEAISIARSYKKYHTDARTFLVEMGEALEVCANE